MPRSTAIHQTADFLAPEEPSPLDPVHTIDDCVDALNHTIEDIGKFDEPDLALRRIKNIETFIKQDLRDQMSQFDAFNKKRAKRRRASLISR